MKVVFHNPHLTSDTWSSGIHDYVVDFLRLYRPHILITPPHRMLKWFRWLKKKGLPLTGWHYVITEAELASADVEISFTGCCLLGHHDRWWKARPRMRIFHTMDYSFFPTESAQKLQEAGVDFLFAYARHDQWCGFFRSEFDHFQNRVIPWPYGYNKRFSCTNPFDLRENKVSVMGAVNRVNTEGDYLAALEKYHAFFSGTVWAHPMRAALREHELELEHLLASYLARPPHRVNLQYDSPTEMNRYKLFVNDDSIMHYPPARTYEGTAAGAVMACSDHPCYEDFGWKNKINCITHPFANIAGFEKAVQQILTEPDELLSLHTTSLEHAKRFAHANVAKELYHTLELLLAGKTDAAMATWSHPTTIPSQDGTQ